MKEIKLDVIRINEDVIVTSVKLCSHPDVEHISFMAGFGDYGRSSFPTYLDAVNLTNRTTSNVNDLPAGVVMNGEFSSLYHYVEGNWVLCENPNKD